MAITASCGHEVADYNDLQTVRYASEDCDAIDGFVPCVSYAEYCARCARKARRWPEFLANDEAADEWLTRAAAEHFAKRHGK